MRNFKPTISPTVLAQWEKWLFYKQKNSNVFVRGRTKMKHEKYSKKSRNFNHVSFVLNYKYGNLKNRNLAILLKL